MMCGIMGCCFFPSGDPKRQEIWDIIANKHLTNKEEEIKTLLEYQEDLESELKRVKQRITELTTK